MNIQMTNEEVRNIVNKLAPGLAAFKEMQVVHRDLHLGQIMIHYPEFEDISDFKELKEKVEWVKHYGLIGSNIFDLKIADFGRARKLSECNDKVFLSKFSRQCIINPDLQERNDNSYGIGVDVWNLGAIIF